MVIWEDNNFNFFTIINGEEVFIGKGRQVPYPLEEGDNWSLPGGESFRYKEGIIYRVEPKNRDEKLKLCLEDLYDKYEESYLFSDPLGFVHRFTAINDIEIAGFLASGFAFGNVAQIIKFLERLEKLLDGRFYDFTLNYTVDKGFDLFNGLYYRFIKDKDIVALFLVLSEMIKKHGSIENFFLEGYNSADLNVKGSLESFSKRALELVDFTSIYGSMVPPKDSKIRYFFTSPKDNSPCKRLNLFLRWMVRNSDNLDFGIWQNIHPFQLIIPVDTHIARISRYLGLTAYKNPSFKMAEDITGNLKRLDFFDPVKYDFALTRLGILDLCPRKKDPGKCKKCSIFDICSA